MSELTSLFTTLLSSTQEADGLKYAFGAHEIKKMSESQTKAGNQQKIWKFKNLNSKIKMA